MAEIKKYTLNFSCGRSLREPDVAEANAARAEIERGNRVRQELANG